MIISDLVTEFLGSKPGFDPEFSDCYLITLHQTLPVKARNEGDWGARDGESKVSDHSAMNDIRYFQMYIFLPFLINCKWKDLSAL